MMYLYVRLIFASSTWGRTCSRGRAGGHTDGQAKIKKTAEGGATVLVSTDHDHDALVQRPTSLECLLLAVHGVVPLQAVLD